MSNGRPWSEEMETPMLRDLASREPVAEIARRMDRPVSTIQKQISARGLEPYHYQRRNWTRRQWLYAEVAGLTYK